MAKRCPIILILCRDETRLDENYNIFLPEGWPWQVPSYSALSKLPNKADLAKLPNKAALAKLPNKNDLAKLTNKATLAKLP